MNSRPGKTVLYADDHEGIRDITSQMLQCLGYKVLPCRNGLEVLSYYRMMGDDIDLIFLDLVMPVMGAYETVTELKSLNNKAPIIVCSGYPNHKEIVKTLRAGAEFFMEKPFALKTLAWALHESLKKAA